MAIRRPRRLVSRVAAGAVTVAVLGVVFAFALPKIASYGDVWRVVQRLSWPWLVALAAATALDMSTLALPWLAALPGLGFVNAFRMTQASTAASLIVPGGATVGMAASFGMLRSWGFRGKQVALAVAVTGIWSQLSTFVFPVAAVLLLAAEGHQRQPHLQLIALIGAAIFVAIAGGLGVALYSSGLARRAGDGSARLAAALRRVVGKGPASWSGQSFVDYRREGLTLVRERWQLLTLTTLANQLSSFLQLVLALRALGVSSHQVTLAEAFAAWSAGRLLSAVPITPGGIGFVELGLTGALVGFGAPSAKAVAAVLVFRFLSVVPVVVLGLASVLTWRLHQPAGAAPQAPGQDP